MPTPAAIIGGDAVAGGTLAVDASRLVIEMRDEIFHYEPDANPLTLLLNKAGRRAVQNPKFEWPEDARTPTIDRVNNSGGYTKGDTSIVVDNGAYIHVNSLVRVQRTGEVMFVSAISTNTLTVTRSFGGTAAAALNDNDQITILGGAAKEKASAEASRVTKKAFKHNFTQIARDPYGASRTLQATKLYGGKFLDVESRFRGVEHAVYIENVLFFGERGSDTTGTEARRSCGGVDEFATTNVKDMGGGLTADEVWDSAESAFRYGSRKKMLFAARAVTSNLELIAEGKLRRVSSDKTYGIAVQQWITGHGVWNVVTHNLLEGDEYALRAYSLDLDQLGYVYLQGADTMLKTNIQANDVDGQKNEYLTEFGLERRLEETHAVWKNAAS